MSQLQRTLQEGLDRYRSELRQAHYHESIARSQAQLLSFWINRIKIEAHKKGIELK